MELRFATKNDAQALRRLAERDSAAVPQGALLIALERGVPVAAISATGEAIADPFVPSAGAVAVLHAYAAHFEQPEPADERQTGPRRAFKRLRTRPFAVPRST